MLLAHLQKKKERKKICHEGKKVEKKTQGQLLGQR